MGGLLEFFLPPGVPGKFCTSVNETNWYGRSLEWHEESGIPEQIVNVLRRIPWCLVSMPTRCTRQDYILPASHLRRHSILIYLRMASQVITSDLLRAGMLIRHQFMEPGQVRIPSCSVFGGVQELRREEESRQASER